VLLGQRLQVQRVQTVEERTLFKGLGNLGNLGSMLKQAGQMRERMQQVGEQLKTKRAVGSAGAGMVEVEVNGAGETLAVRIDPTLVEKGDREMIEDLLVAASNSARIKAKELYAEAMREVTAGMNMPGLDAALSEFGGDQTVD